MNVAAFVLRYVKYNEDMLCIRLQAILLVLCLNNSFMACAAKCYVPAYMKTKDVLICRLYA